MTWRWFKSNLRFSLGILLNSKGMRKSAKNLRWDNQSSDQDLNSGPLECDAELLPAWEQSSEVPFRCFKLYLNPKPEMPQASSSVLFFPCTCSTDPLRNFTTPHNWTIWNFPVSLWKANMATNNHQSPLPEFYSLSLSFPIYLMLYSLPLIECHLFPSG